MATFSAFWALFCTVHLHVFQVKSSALGFKNCCCVHAESNDAKACLRETVGLPKVSFG